MSIFPCLIFHLISIFFSIGCCPLHHPQDLSERVEQYDLETGFVAVVAAELPSGELECAQLSGVSYLKVKNKKVAFTL